MITRMVSNTLGAGWQAGLRTTAGTTRLVIDAVVGRLLDTDPQRVR